MNKNGARMELHIEWVSEVIGRIFLIIQHTQQDIHHWENCINNSVPLLKEVRNFSD